MCPDTDFLKDNYKLRNGYEQKNNRIATSYQIIVCNSKMVDNCKNESDIKKFLEQTYITQYFVEEALDFKKQDRPVGA